MKITICGCLAFYEEMKRISAELKSKGYETELPEYLEERDYSENKDFKKQGEITGGNDLIKKHYKRIRSSDAILIVNFTRKGIDNYIGGNTFLEMGFAYILGKKIYVYNSLPADNKINYTEEMHAMFPIILNGDLTKIK